MNTTSGDPTALPPQPPRSSFSCDRHPREQYTGFCSSCLCERLTSLDQSSSNTPFSSRRPSSASATTAIKSLFSSSSKTTKTARPGSLLPELRRSKSFSASKNEALGLNFEPQRKSCDVRGRNTLWSLFTLEDEDKTATHDTRLCISGSTSYQNHSKKSETCVVNNTVLEETENEEDVNDIENLRDGVSTVDYSFGEGNGTRPIRSSHFDSCLVNSGQAEVKNPEIVVEDAMNGHIQIDNQQKKSSSRVFWAAASVFSKKWQKWRRKEKIKKRNTDKNLTTLPVEKPISRQYRETQSEIADYGFGRRSCDTDPRFSLDAGRISLDDPRYSFDEPRASWDGYLIGRNIPRLAPMLSVLEDSPTVHVLRSDMQIPVESQTSNSIEDEAVIPGGNAQTREYYSDSSSSKRRKSLDRSTSIRKTAAAVVAEIDELKMVSNAKVSPATMDCYNGAREFGDSNSNSLRDDCSEAFELGSGYRESSNSMISSCDRKESKKTKRWSWRIWGFIYRRGIVNKEEDESKTSRSTMADRSFSESRRDRLNRHISRSNSSVSIRNHSHRSSRNVKKPEAEMNGHGRRRRDEFVLERKRSLRYSPSHMDNGLLRFYLTPMRSSRRLGLGKIKPNHSQSIRSVLSLY